MSTRTDSQVIQELYYHSVAVWRAGGQSPIHESRLFAFLSQLVPTDRIAHLINIAERSNMIARLAGTDTYIPRPRSHFTFPPPTTITEIDIPLSPPEPGLNNNDPCAFPTLTVE